MQEYRRLDKEQDAFQSDVFDGVVWCIVNLLVVKVVLERLLPRGERRGDGLLLVVVGGGLQLGLQLSLERFFCFHHQLCDQEKSGGVQRKMRPTCGQSARKVVGG